MNFNIPSSAYEAIKSFKELTQSMGRNFQEELIKCAKTKGQGLIADALSHAIYKGSSKVIKLAIEVISTGIVDLKSTFYNLYAPNGQATLKFYATLKGEYGVVEAIERQEHNLHNLEVEVSGDALDIV